MARARRIWSVVTVAHDDPIEPTEFTDIEELRKFLARQPVQGVQCVVFAGKPVPFEIDRQPVVNITLPRPRRRLKAGEETTTTERKPRQRRRNGAPEGGPTVGGLLDARSQVE